MAHTPDNILHKTLHDRFSTTRNSGERAILALALQAFNEVQLRRQETLGRIRELSFQIQRTESQMMHIYSQLFNRTSQTTCSLDKYTLADMRVLDTLNAMLSGQEMRLRATKEELAAAEQRLATLVTTWATSK